MAFLLLGYAGALLMGISLGLIGAGGSILSVPIFKYLMGYSAELSTSYSLFVVGLTALFGAVSYIRAGRVHYLYALIFGAPSLISVYFVRKYLMAGIPVEIVALWGFQLTKDRLIMLVFALFMVLASYSMIHDFDLSQGVTNHNALIKRAVVILEGVLIGAITGFVGAGGGFMIIPALVVFVGLPMNQAIGTSLLIIGFKSIAGFVGDVGRFPIDWGVLTAFSSIAVLGILFGSQLSKRVSDKRLKKTFGYFVLVVGSFILLEQTL